MPSRKNMVEENVSQEFRFKNLDETGNWKLFYGRHRSKGIDE